MRTIALCYLLLLLLLSGGCVNSANSDPVSPDIAELREEVTRLRDERAIEALGTCYARGLDEISLRNADRPKGKMAATELYARCFDPNVKISVYPVGAKTPFKVTATIPEWVEFADGFYASVGYSSTRHLVSNYTVERTSDTTARMTSFAVGPHFLKSTAREPAAAAPTIEYYSLRYVDDVVRQADGSWRVVAKSVYFDEVWRGIGFFPNGNPDGL